MPTIKISDNHQFWSIQILFISKFDNFQVWPLLTISGYPPQIQKPALTHKPEAYLEHNYLHDYKIISRRDFTLQSDGPYLNSFSSLSQPFTPISLILIESYLFPGIFKELSVFFFLSGLKLSKFRMGQNETKSGNYCSPFYKKNLIKSNLIVSLSFLELLFL